MGLPPARVRAGVLSVILVRAGGCPNFCGRIAQDRKKRDSSCRGGIRVHAYTVMSVAWVLYQAFLVIRDGQQSHFFLGVLGKTEDACNSGSRRGLSQHLLLCAARVQECCISPGPLSHKSYSSYSGRCENGVCRMCRRGTRLLFSTFFPRLGQFVADILPVGAFKKDLLVFPGGGGGIAGFQAHVAEQHAYAQIVGVHT